jgi:hypothetical protein
MGYNEYEIGIQFVNTIFFFNELVASTSNQTKSKIEVHNFLETQKWVKLKYNLILSKLIARTSFFGLQHICENNWNTKSYIHFLSFFSNFLLGWPCTLGNLHILILGVLELDVGGTTPFPNAGVCILGDACLSWVLGLKFSSSWEKSQTFYE